jgi:twinkle protein
MYIPIKKGLQMAELPHQPCPYDGCYSTDAFSYNTEGYGKCHSCSRKYPSKDKLLPWANEKYPTAYSMNSEQEKLVVNSTTTSTMTKLSVVENLLTPVIRGYRDINKDVMAYYNVTTYVDANGEPVKQDYIYPAGGKKVRTLPKSFRAEGGFKGDELFGMDKFNAGCAKAVTITEGELDALSAYQMLGSKYPVVSLPSATPSGKLFEKCKDWLGSFEKIYLSFDSDGKSDGVAHKLANIFPNRVYNVPHDKYKDANEFLQAGAAKEYSNAWWNAQKYIPENIFNTTEQFLSIIHDEDDSSYLSTGIQALDDVILGLMRGHFTVFQAPEGIGKTEFMRFLEFNLLMHHDNIPIAICHMEEVKKRSLLGLASYQLDKNVTRRDLITNQTEVDDAIKLMTEKENLYQFTIGVDDDPNSILEQIRFLSQACGVHYIFFEPIQDLAYSRQGDESAEQFLSQLATKLARLSAELNVGIVTIAHENDDGAIRDSRMIGKRASVVIKLKRDKMADDADARNTTELLVIKNRPTGSTGYAGQLFFNSDTFTLSEKGGNY